MFALDNLKIGAFRGLRDLDLDGLGRVNLLVGPNNSGKTSILEAVPIFCHPVDFLSWFDVTWRREAPLKPEKPFFMGMEWMFPHLRLGDGPVVSDQVTISGSGKCVVRSVRSTYEIRTRVGAHAAPQQTATPYQQRGAVIQVEGRADSDPKSLSRAFELWEGETVALSEYQGWPRLPVRTVSPVDHRSEATQMAELSAVARQGLIDWILKMLRSLDPEIRDIRILTPQENSPAIFIDYASSGLIPLSGFGDGVRRAFLIALVLNSARGGVLLIDEIELALHVSALETLFSWLVRACEEFDVQLFATTHSLEAIDTMIHAERGDLSRIVGYRLKPSGGSVKAQRLEGQLLSRMRIEHGFDVRL
ncbi:MAG TPA: AAA family ATPase [Bryobacteraceae bacterium]|nr:AAA family ATPase [Bryobacteraceae bacterium]